MAESLTAQGLDLILTYFPKGTAGATTTHLALFTALAATTGETGSSLGDTPDAVVRTGITEPDFGSYARQPIVGSSGWATPVAGTSGRKVIGSQVTWPAATTPNSAADTLGFWLADTITTGNVYGLANFDDGTAVRINIGDIMKVTPTFQFNF
jgi:hypothetical protein